MNKIILLLLISFSLMSCATHKGAISTSSINRNVNYVDIAYGISQSSKVLGIGGLSQDAMVLEAKRELFKNRPLNANEEYANFTIDFKRTYVFLYFKNKVTMSADVVKYTRDTISDPFTAQYKTKLFIENNPNDLFGIGDTILYDKDKKGLIISINNSEKVRVLYKTEKNKLKSKNVSVESIYTTSKSVNGLKVGDRYVFDWRISGKDVKQSGTIIAFGLTSFMIKTQTMGIITLNYKK